MRYKKGDKVRIRNFSDIIKECDKLMLVANRIVAPDNSYMLYDDKELCGTTVEIIKAIPSSKSGIVYYIMKDLKGRLFSEFFLESIHPKKLFEFKDIKFVLDNDDI